uniref:Uncharacterized protein n=1 Tax=Oryza glumipatula TaxID=40148 RepID=A0A0E0B9R3_9ORYZ
MSRVAASCSEASTAEGNSMPYDHQSMPAPCPPLRATSGATYSCVPTNELDRACTGSARDAHHVQILEREEHLSGVEPGERDWESTTGHALVL